jgi:hypothetical protein
MGSLGATDWVGRDALPIPVRHGRTSTVPKIAEAPSKIVDLTTAA